MFKVAKNGFVVGLPNGYEVSVMFGKGNYCSNRNEICRDNMGNLVCGNAEILVFKEGGNDILPIATIVGFQPGWAFNGDGTGLSWANPEQFAALVAKVSELPDWRSPEGEA